MSNSESTDIVLSHERGLSDDHRSGRFLGQVDQSSVQFEVFHERIWRTYQYLAQYDWVTFEGPADHIMEKIFQQFRDYLSGHFEFRRHYLPILAEFFIAWEAGQPLYREKLNLLGYDEAYTRGSVDHVYDNITQKLDDAGFWEIEQSGVYPYRGSSECRIDVLELGSWASKWSSRQKGGQRPHLGSLILSTSPDETVSDMEVRAEKLASYFKHLVQKNGGPHLGYVERYHIAKNGAFYDSMNPRSLEFVENLQRRGYLRTFQRLLLENYPNRPEPPSHHSSSSFYYVTPYLLTDPGVPDYQDLLDIRQNLGDPEHIFVWQTVNALKDNLSDRIGEGVSSQDIKAICNPEVNRSSKVRKKYDGIEGEVREPTRDELGIAGRVNCTTLYRITEFRGETREEYLEQQRVEQLQSIASESDGGESRDPSYTDEDLERDEDDEMTIEDIPEKWRSLIGEFQLSTDIDAQLYIDTLIHIGYRRQEVEGAYEWVSENGHAMVTIHDIPHDGREYNILDVRLWEEGFPDLRSEVRQFESLDPDDNERMHMLLSYLKKRAESGKDPRYIGPIKHREISEVLDVEESGGWVVDLILRLERAGYIRVYRFSKSGGDMVFHPRLSRKNYLFEATPLLLEDNRIEDYECRCRRRDRIQRKAPTTIRDWNTTAGLADLLNKFFEENGYFPETEITKHDVHNAAVGRCEKHYMGPFTFETREVYEEEKGNLFALHTTQVHRVKSVDESSLPDTTQSPDMTPRITDEMRRCIRWLYAHDIDFRDIGVVAEIQCIGHMLREDSEELDHAVIPQNLRTLGYDRMYNEIGGVLCRIEKVLSQMDRGPWFQYKRDFGNDGEYGDGKSEQYSLYKILSFDPREMPDFRPYLLSTHRWRDLSTSAKEVFQGMLERSKHLENEGGRNYLGKVTIDDVNNWATKWIRRDVSDTLWELEKAGLVRVFRYPQMVGVTTPKPRFSKYSTYRVYITPHGMRIFEPGSGIKWEGKGFRQAKLDFWFARHAMEGEIVVQISDDQNTEEVEGAKADLVGGIRDANLEAIRHWWYLFQKELSAECPPLRSAGWRVGEDTTGGRVLAVYTATYKGDNIKVCRVIDEKDTWELRINGEGAGEVKLDDVMASLSRYVSAVSFFPAKGAEEAWLPQNIQKRLPN